MPTVAIFYGISDPDEFLRSRATAFPRTVWPRQSAVPHLGCHHRAELKNNWLRAQAGRPLEKIAGPDDQG